MRFEDLEEILIAGGSALEDGEISLSLDEMEVWRCTGLHS